MSNNPSSLGRPENHCFECTVIGRNGIEVDKKSHCNSTVVATVLPVNKALVWDPMGLEESVLPTGKLWTDN